ncbi:hypothetical protein H6F89_29705 [Cyanobacteria bacterium FACHB-63]|nr:hypothetical protein [Cyanobacteria bacterium FACHB-63]
MKRKLKKPGTIALLGLIGVTSFQGIAQAQLLNAGSVLFKNAENNIYVRSVPQGEVQSDKRSIAGNLY